MDVDYRHDSNGNKLRLPLRGKLSVNLLHNGFWD